MKSQTIEAQCTKNRFKYNLLFVLLTFQVICQNQPDDDIRFDTYYLLTSRINPSITLLTSHDFIFKCTSLSIRKNIFTCKNIFKSLRLRISEFVNPPYPWPDLIINPSCRTTTSHKFTQKSLFNHLIKKLFYRKRSLYTLGGHYHPARLENHVGITCSLNICR